MSEHQRYQKEEKWQRDPINMITWAAVFIWAGLVLLAETMSIMQTHWWNAWAVIFVGAGVIVILGAIIRLRMPTHRRLAGGNLIFGLILLGIGLGGLIGWGMVWPLALIAFGLLILLRSFARRH